MIFTLDKGIKTMLGDISGLAASVNDPINSDIIVSSNSWAFRNRIIQRKSLVLPFINFRVVPAGIKRVEKVGFPKNYALSVEGIYEPDIEKRVTCKSFTATYEATYWGYMYTNTMEKFQKFFSQLFQDNLIKYDITISGSTLTFKAPFEFTNLEFDPQWNAADELDKGRIHSIDVSFTVDAFLFETIGNYGALHVSYDKGNPCKITSPSHGLTSGATVSVGGSVNGEIDGNFVVTVIDANNFVLEGKDNSAGVGGFCDWYAGVKPVDKIEVEMFYTNGAPDNGMPPNREFEVNRP